MELIPPLGDGKVIDSSPASVHKDPNSECLRPEIPGLEKLRNGVSMQEKIIGNPFNPQTLRPLSIFREANMQHTDETQKLFTLQCEVVYQGRE